MNSRLDNILALIDEANQQDPNQERSEGQLHPKEWLYSQRMSACLAQFEPLASEHLKIAAHGQHIERWTSPRGDYPEGRAGYKKWRAELGLFHANRVAELMDQCGYEQTDIDRVKYLVQKRGLKRDAETQCLEDVICLVFLEHYFDEFAEKHEKDKLIPIIQKTWAKMSDKGHQAALALVFPKHLGALIEEALAAS